MVKYMEDSSANANLFMISSIASSCEANASLHTNERTNARKKIDNKRNPNKKKSHKHWNAKVFFSFHFFAYFVLMLFIRLSTPDLCSSPDHVSLSLSSGDSMQQLLHIRAESVARLVSSSTTLHRAHKCVVMWINKIVDFCLAASRCVPYRRREVERGRRRETGQKTENFDILGGGSHDPAICYAQLAVEPFEFTTRTKKKEPKTGTHTLALFRCARQRNSVTEPKIVSTFAEITERSDAQRRK